MKLNELLQQITPGEWSEDVINRFISKIKPLPNGCWEWAGDPNCNGYGRFYPSKRQGWLAHRFMVSLIRGITPDVCACHHCDNRMCVNPDHIFLGDRNDNLKDMARKGRGRNAMTDATSCPKGHPYTPENTYRWMNKGKLGRRCKTCYDAYTLKRSALAKAENIN